MPLVQTSAHGGSGEVSLFLPDQNESSDYEADADDCTVAPEIDMCVGDSPGVTPRDYEFYD